MPRSARHTRGKQASAAVTNNMRHHTSCSAGSVMSLPRMAVMPHSTTQMWISMSARRWGFMGETTRCRWAGSLLPTFVRAASRRKNVCCTTMQTSGPGRAGLGLPGHRAGARAGCVRALRAYDLPGYTIITHDDNTASKMVPSIAAVEQVLLNPSSRDIAPTGRPTHVYIVRLGLWRRYLQPADLFSGEFHATRFADYLMAANSGDRAEVRRSVMHLFTHRYMHTQYGGVYPLWFDEGLAELMSVAELRTSQVLLGQVHLSGNAWIPLNRLLRIDRSAPEYLSMVSSGSLHAESWALVHQAFIGSEPALKEQMLAYLRDANDLMPVDDAVQKNFRMDVSQLNAKVMAYANDPSWRTDSVPFFTRIPTPELGAGREIPEDEALVMLATAMLDTGSRPDRVGEVIDSLEKQAPGSPAAWSLRMRMAARDRDDALLDQLWDLIEPKTQAPAVARDAGFALFYESSASAKTTACPHLTALDSEIVRSRYLIERWPPIPMMSRPVGHMPSSRPISNATSTRHCSA